MKTIFFALCFFLSLGILSAQEQPVVMEWIVDGETRQALAYIPASAKTGPTPVVFAFHGHGGTMKRAFQQRNFHQLWPESIFICPQGLNTPGLLTDPEGKKSGWVMDDKTDANRDIQFVDAMLKTVRANYKIDNSRVYATGHSNGGGFTYLLWALRANEFAAFAPTATAAGKLVNRLIPKPVLHLMGENDPLVKPVMQKMTCNRVLKLNECEKEGKPIGKNITFYAGKNGNDVTLYIHNEGHQYPNEANRIIIDFFKKYPKK